jgi:hypothetical protein
METADLLLAYDGPTMSPSWRGWDDRCAPPVGLWSW